MQEVGYPLVFVNEYLERSGGSHGHCSHLRKYNLGMRGCRLDSRLKVWYR